MNKLLFLVVVAMAFVLLVSSEQNPESSEQSPTSSGQKPASSGNKVLCSTAKNNFRCWFCCNINNYFKHKFTPANVASGEASNCHCSDRARFLFGGEQY